MGRHRYVVALLVAALVAVPLGPGAGAETPPGPDADGCETHRLVAPLPAEAAPVGRTPCPGVRPGALVRTDLGGCTLNFAFRGSDGRNYVGTAGHCILQEDGGRAWRPGAGPWARNAAGKRIGRFSFAVLDSERDFALIRVNRGVKVRSSLCHWGGPTRGDRGTPAVGAPLRHFGQGIGLGASPVGNTPVLPARTAVLRTATKDMIYADGAAIFGDSGSAVIEADGTARGVLVNLQLVPTRGLIGISRLGVQRRQAERALGVRLRLRTASLAG